MQEHHIKAFAGAPRKEDGREVFSPRQEELDRIHVPKRKRCRFREYKIGGIPADSSFTVRALSAACHLLAKGGQSHACDQRLIVSRVDGAAPPQALSNGALDVEGVVYTNRSAWETCSVL